MGYVCHNPAVRAPLLVALCVGGLASGCFLEREGTRPSGEDAALPSDDGGPRTFDAAACPGVDVTSDPANCGACGAACLSVPTATSTCVTGVCGLSCNPGRGDCDTDPATGCEVDLMLDSAHCGACSDSCASSPLGPNQLAGGCAGGVCEVRCIAGFADCDGDPGNGCESNIETERMNCGRCGNVCRLVAGSQPLCVSGECTVQCDTIRFQDCNGDPLDGCETDVQDPAHCGVCPVAPIPMGRVCTFFVGRCTCGATDCSCDI